jgi:hypothetical protein
MKPPPSSKKDYKFVDKKLNKNEKIRGNMASTDTKDRSFGGIWDDKNGVFLFPDVPCADGVLDGSESAVYSRKEYFKKKQDLYRLSKKIVFHKEGTAAFKEGTKAVIVRYYNAARTAMNVHMSDKDWDCTTFFEDICWMADIVALLLGIVGTSTQSEIVSMRIFRVVPVDMGSNTWPICNSMTKPDYCVL